MQQTSTILFVNSGVHFQLSTILKRKGIHLAVTLLRGIVEMNIPNNWLGFGCMGGTFLMCKSLVIFPKQRGSRLGIAFLRQCTNRPAEVLWVDTWLSEVAWGIVEASTMSYLFTAKSRVMVMEDNANVQLQHCTVCWMQFGSFMLLSAVLWLLYATHSCETSISAPVYLHAPNKTIH